MKNILTHRHLLGDEKNKRQQFDKFQLCLFVI